MTADPGTHPPSLRTVLREAQRALDDAAAEHFAHRREHRCREGSCAEGKRLAEITGTRQWELSMTRFLNED
jgi:uncharacterized membrane-anchored protein